MSQEKTPKKPLIIAHRGASALAPENTLAAFALALKQGADGIELDVMLTRDKELAVIHDASVDRTTNGNGLVAEMTLADLRKLDAGSKFSPDFAGEPIPTLRQVLELTGSRILVNIELKNYAHPLDALTECVIRLVQELGLSQSVLLSSFNRSISAVPNALIQTFAEVYSLSPVKQARYCAGQLGNSFPTRHCTLTMRM